MKKHKFKWGIFQKLVISYIVFAVATVIIFFICLMMAATGMSEGDVETLSPYTIIDKNGTINNLNTVTNMGGWIEELDAEYRVVAVHGTKLTPQEQYTPGEICELTSANPYTDLEYIGFIQYVEGQQKYYMIVYERKVMQVSTTVQLDALGRYGTAKWSYVFDGVLLLLFFGICILISLYLRKKIKRPLDALIDGMERVKAGEPEVVVEVQTEAEFEQIIDTFHVMVQQLEKEKQEKEALVQKKNQLLMELSHDIKTPIATIKSYANALEAGLVPEEKKSNYYHTIDQKANRLQTLAEDMFLMLKMDYADYKLQVEAVDICELLRKICAEYYEEIEAAGFSFEIEIPERACVVPLDARLFTRVIANLLTNALKYNQTGNQIVLRGKAGTTGMEAFQIEVEDDGEPIAKEAAAHLFDAFMRGDRARSTDGGTGLGLAIAKAIVERHGGSIGYEAMEQGNRFRVVLNADA